jgi:hypothetical protein
MFFCKILILDGVGMARELIKNKKTAISIVFGILCISIFPILIKLRLTG